MTTPLLEQITFEGQTTHEDGITVTGGEVDTADISLDSANRLFFSKQIHNRKGIVVSGSTEPIGIPLVNVNYRLIPNGQADNRPETGYVVTRSRASFVSGDSANHVSCFLASTMDGVNNANIQNQYAFYAGGSLSTAFNNYGFYSNLGANGHQGGAAYNFYAAGNAPNYFAGDVNVEKTIFLPEGFDSTKAGQQGCQIGSTSVYRSRVSNDTAAMVTYARTSSASKPMYINFFTRHNGDRNLGNIRQNNNTNNATGVQFNTSGTRAAFIHLADERNTTYVDFAGNAADTVKLLQPKVNGFIPHQLQTLVADAVTGIKDATEAIGTYTDVDGSVETEVTEPEAIPFGATWQQTGIRDVYQGVDQTKLIPLLTKALQEALARIEALEADHATLMNNGGY